MGVKLLAKQLHIASQYCALVLNAQVSSSCGLSMTASRLDVEVAAALPEYACTSITTLGEQL